MQLADLPQFTITGARCVDASWVLDGQFNHLRTVRSARSWLYVSRTDSLIGDLEHLDPATRRAQFNTMDLAPPPQWIRNATLPWVDGYWQAYHIALILDTEHRWERVTFGAGDALQSRVPGWRVRRAADGAVPTSTEIAAPGAWDHEHCMLCNARVNPGDAAYTDVEDNWLCVRCFVAYAERHELSFMSRV